MTTSAGAATLELAIDKAEATGDVRLAALARVHLGRVLRAVGQVERARAALEAASEWHRDSGGGEQAALGECLLAAMDAADGVPGAADRLAATLDEARRRDDAAVEVFALDALARIAAQRATSRPPVTSVRRLICAWRLPPTSSPSSTGRTPDGSDRMPERLRRLKPS